jgi:hydroxyethylthiazole kinase-like uncharacterized protein yjeF
MKGMLQVRRVVKLPGRDRNAHKGDFGRLLVIAGSEGMLGAAVLCARAATRSGAGLVRVALPKSLISLLPLAVPEATTMALVRGAAGAKALQQHLLEADAVVVGPGLTTQPSTKHLVKWLLQHSRVPMVLDADALNVLSPLPHKPGFGLPCKAPLVLTPHPGEAARLLGSTTQAVQSDRAAALAELCQRSGAIVVLKGQGTLVADGKRYFRNSTGNPGMAGGGSGDVLSGVIGALLARGMPPFEATCLAVHAHGKAGDLASAQHGENGMVASDLPDAMAQVLR